MDEDETVVLKHTGLYSHLLATGYEDFEVVTNDERSTNSPQIILDDFPYQDNFVPVFEDYETIINAILNSRLVFKDDVLLVKNFIVHMKPLLQTRSFFKNIVYSKVTIQTVTVTSGLLACITYGVKVKPSIYVFLPLIPLSFHAVKVLYTTWRERRRCKILAALLNNMKKLSLLVNKSIQFIHEREVFGCAVVHKLNSDVINPNAYIGEQDSMNHLRFSTFHAIRSAILDFKILIITLVRNFPLKAHVHAASFYLAFLDEMDLHCAYFSEMTISVNQLQKMKYVCFLLQSEFLRQLALCFVPSLWVCNMDKLLKNVFQIIEELNIKFMKRREQLKTIFEVYYTCAEEDDAISTRSVDAQWTYKEAYIKLCSVSLNLRTALKNSRSMEEYLDETRTEDVPYDVVVREINTMTERIVRDHGRCKAALEDLQRYVQGIKPKHDSFSSTDRVQVSESTSTISTNIRVGSSNFDPIGADEVFVGVPDDDSKNVEHQDDLCDPKDQSHQCSKMLMDELKIALQSKAKEFKEREKLALLSKNIEIDQDELLVFADNLLKDQSSSEEELISITRKAQAENIKFQPIKNEETFAKNIANAAAAFNVKVEQFGEEESDKEE